MAAFGYARGAERNELWERHHVFDVALSRSKHRTVGARLPAIASCQSLIFCL